MDSTGGQSGPAVPQTVELDFGAFPHLSLPEWMAFERMRRVLGEDTVLKMLQSLSPGDQKNAAVNFMHNEVTGTQRLQATPVSSNRVFPLKLDVSTYKGTEREPLLRWFVELDAAIESRQLHDQYQQVAFAMSKLGGRAKSWAYGKRLADPNCFPSYDSFKVELRQAFEPPKCEFRARAEFLELRQGRMDLHEYAQRARYLVSSIVCDPIDSATQVVKFVKGLNDGPVRTQLFREYPQSMEEAISLALQEDFSLKQAKIQGPAPRHPRQSQVHANDHEPMDLSQVSTSQTETPRNDGKCFRCGKPGHFARNCKVSLPGGQSTRGRRFGHGGRVSTKNETRGSQSSTLIVVNVSVEGFEEPLRALIDTGPSNNFVREQVVKSHGISVPELKTGMVVRLANGTTVHMAKRVTRLKMRFEGFRGEDESILLDLDEKFNLILGITWLKRFQPRIDWANMKISLGSSPSVEVNGVTAGEVIWAFTSVEEFPDGPSDVAECDGPPYSRGKSKKIQDVVAEQQPQQAKNGGGTVRRQKKTVSFALAHGEASSVDVKGGDQEPTRV